MSALCKAIQQKRFRQAKLLVELGVDVNRRDESSGKTPLVAACFLENEALACQITRCLVNHGADVKRTDREGMTALMHACRLSKEKLARELLKTQECDLHSKDNEGNTALMHSIMAGNSGVVKTLTESLNRYQLRGVDIPNNTGETPLIKAAKLGRTECTRVLLTNGKASPNARDLHWKLTAGEWQELLTSDNKEDFTSAGAQYPPRQKKIYTLQIINRGYQLSEKTRQTMTSLREDECALTTAKTMNHICKTTKDSKNPHVHITKIENSKKSGFESQRNEKLKGSRHEIEANQARLRASSVRSAITDRDRGMKQVPRDSSFVSEGNRVQSSSQRVMLEKNANKVHGVKARGNDVSTNMPKNCLSDLLSVLAHQNSPSFRPSVKPPPAEKFPETEAELRDKIRELWSSGVKKSRKNSFALERSTSVSGGRLSRTARAAKTWRRFSSIYSQGDFANLRGDRINAAHHERRLSIATPTDSRTKVSFSGQARRLSIAEVPAPPLNTSKKLSDSRLERSAQRRREGQQPSILRKHSEITSPLFIVKESTFCMENDTRNNAFNTQAPNEKQ